MANPDTVGVDDVAEEQEPRRREAGVVVKAKPRDDLLDSERSMAPMSIIMVTGERPAEREIPAGLCLQKEIMMVDQT